MGELLRNFGAMIPLTIITIPYALIAWPLLTAHRRRKRPAGAAATAAMDVTIIALAFLVLCLVTMRVGDSHSSSLHLMPGMDMQDALDDDNALWQVGGNLVMLSPLGALLPMRSVRLRSVRRIALAAMLVSMMIEGMQYVIHAGRVTSTDDVILNTIGAAMGAAASRPWWSRVRLVPKPLVIPAQRGRQQVCESPTLRLRVPRSVWEPTVRPATRL